MKVCDGIFQPEETSYETIFKNWPFTLSDFQKWGIYSIHNNSDCLVYG